MTGTISFIEYSVKETGRTADTVREFIRNTFGIDAYVALYPDLLRIRLTSGIPSKEIDKLTKWVEEELDGSLLRSY